MIIFQLHFFFYECYKVSFHMMLPCYIPSIVYIPSSSSPLKDIYFVMYGIVSEFTDKGQFPLSHKIKGASSGELPVYNTISFAEIKINILS